MAQTGSVGEASKERIELSWPWQNRDGEVRTKGSSVTDRSSKEQRHKEERQETKLRD